MRNYDVIVCGAGIVGLATALQLAKEQIKVAILAPAIQPKANLGEQYHPRIYALSKNSQAFLDSLGIWSVLPAERYNRVEKMQVFADQGSQILLDSATISEAQMAWIIESGEIEAALYQAVKIYGIEWIDARFKAFNQGEVITEQGQSFTTKLLVGADGASSKVRDDSYITHHKKEYGDYGLVLHLNCEKPHQNIAYQWFTSQGILALLPLPDTQQGHQVSMVWSIHELEAKRWLDKSPKELQDHLPARLNLLSHSCLGQLHVRSPLFGFPLTLERSGMIAQQVALVGDAAHRVHPLAGQGLNLGLSDAVTLCRVLKEKESYRDYDDFRLLERYRNQRAEEVMAMRLATDGLYQLFNSTLPFSAFIRNMGMSFVNQSNFLKKQLIRAASGQE